MLAIRAAHLFDGERFWPGPATVLTNGATVLGIEQGHPDLPAGTDVLDPGDTTVLPGLIDSHTHLVGDSRDGALNRVASYIPRTSWLLWSPSHCGPSSRAV